MDVYNPTKNEWDKIPSMNQVSLQTHQHWEFRLALVSSQCQHRCLGVQSQQARVRTGHFPSVVSLHSGLLLSSTCVWGSPKQRPYIRCQSHIA